MADEENALDRMRRRRAEEERRGGGPRTQEEQLAIDDEVNVRPVTRYTEDDPATVRRPMPLPPRRPSDAELSRRPVPLPPKRPPAAQLRPQPAPAKKAAPATAPAKKPSARVPESNKPAVAAAMKSYQPRDPNASYVVTPAQMQRAEQRLQQRRNPETYVPFEEGAMHRDTAPTRQQDFSEDAAFPESGTTYTSPGQDFNDDPNGGQRPQDFSEGAAFPESGTRYSGPGQDLGIDDPEGKLPLQPGGPAQLSLGGPQQRSRPQQAALQQPRTDAQDPQSAAGQDPLSGFIDSIMRSLMGDASRNAISRSNGATGAAPVPRRMPWV